ncbi:MAG TPA: hypothetical protein PLD88_08040, partial [Candidatus Berkiella sp.]|nr:hypothetical protein [Candidatus Berkiella sp.]
EKERLNRRREDKKKPTRLIQSMPFLPIKEEPLFLEAVPEDQVIKCKSAPLLFTKTKRQKNVFMEPNQPTVSGSRAISEEESLGGFSRDVMQLSIHEESLQEYRNLSRNSIMEGERESRFKRTAL